MNKHDPTEHFLREFQPPTAPSSLRADILEAIEAERNSELFRTSVALAKRNWFATFEHIASFASPCMLLMSLMILGLVDWSTGDLLQSNLPSITDSVERIAGNNSVLPSKGSPDSPHVFFRKYLAILQSLNAELFHETPGKNPQEGGDRSPLGRLRARVDCRISELASLTQGGGSAGSAA